MVTYLPISSPFIRFAGRFVDDAFGFAAGWNFFVFEAALVPFEIVACNVIIGFWSQAVPAGGIIAIVLVLYAYVDPFTILVFGIEHQTILCVGFGTATNLLFSLFCILRFPRETLESTCSKPAHPIWNILRNVTEAS